MYRHRCIQSEKHNSRDTHAARFKFLAASVVLSVRRHRLPVVQRDRTSLGKAVDDTRSRLSSLPKLVAGRDNRAYNVSSNDVSSFFFFFDRVQCSKSTETLSRRTKKRSGREEREKKPLSTCSLPKHFRKTGFSWVSYVPRPRIHKFDRAATTNVFLHWMARGRHKNS